MIDNNDFMTIKNSLYDKLDKDEYLDEIYFNIIFNYAKRVFNVNNIIDKNINIDDSISFADILSKSTGLKNTEKHKILSQEIVSLLHFLYPTDQKILFTMSSVLLNTGNFRGCKLVKSKYNGISYLDYIYNNFQVSYFNIPNEDNLYFLSNQKEIFTNMDTKLFSYSGPTSIGKSFLMRIFIKNKILNNFKHNFTIVVPTRALINEITTKIINDLKNDLESKNYRLVNSANSLLLEEEHNFIFVLTPERLLYLLISKPEINIDYVFIDEAHKLSSTDKRSPFYYEIASILLKRSKKPNFIFASPNIPNPEEYLKIILKDNFTNKNQYSFTSQYSPVSQIKFIINKDSNQLSFFNEKLKKYNTLFNIQPFNLFNFMNNSNAKTQNIVYCHSKNKAIEDAKEYADTLPELNESRLQTLSAEIKKIVHNDYYLSDIVKKGVAYHIGYLPTMIRNRIEQCYRDGIIKTIFCTKTLLEGINLPADNLFIYYKSKHTHLCDVDYKNLIGRVGRIEYNLYGNVFFIVPNEPNEISKLNNLLSNDIPHQTLSIYTEISKNQKKKIITKLLECDFEFEHYPKNQSEDNYDTIRKFSLILAKDILYNNNSIVKESFKDILTPELELKIKHNLSSMKLKQDSDINFSADQQKNLIEAINNGLSYPPITSTNSYKDLLSFLEKLCEIFKWEKYENKKLGYVKNNCHKKLEYYTLLLLRWVQGNGLNYIITKALDDKRKRPNEGVWLDNHKISDSYNGSIEHNNIIISNTLNDIEDIILFRLSNYFLRFSTEFKKLKPDEKFEDWYEYVEYGTTNPLNIFLQKYGFSRETSSFLKDNKDLYIDTTTNKTKIKNTIFEIDEELILEELYSIKYNIPDLFI